MYHAKSILTGSKKSPEVAAKPPTTMYVALSIVNLAQLFFSSLAGSKRERARRALMRHAEMKSGWLEER